MQAIIRIPLERHLIDRGRVYCPVRGRDVELGLCAGCARLLEIDERTAPPYVRCEPTLASCA